ncbi:MAG: PEGA domain-containing protein [Candidatus Omnitrophota bacterium]|nr:PEGA domain-containing protein [Candidatus Omnitrophota bacterium]
MVYGLVCGLFLTGCVRRSLTIRTEPPGAFVYVNDELKGQSPVTYDFLWYGWHRVMLRREGYERLEDRRRLDAPPHLWIPFDLVMELLPLQIIDTRVLSYTLTPTQELPTPSPPPLTSSSATAPSASGSSAPPVPSDATASPPRQESSDAAR